MASVQITHICFERDEDLANCAETRISLHSVFILMHCDNWKSQEKLWHFGGKILLWQCTAVVLRDCTTYIHHCGSWGRFCVWWWWWWCDFLVRCWRKYGGGGGGLLCHLHSKQPYLPPPIPLWILCTTLWQHCSSSVYSTTDTHFMFQKEFRLIIHLEYICKVSRYLVWKNDQACIAS